MAERGSGQKRRMPSLKKRLTTQSAKLRLLLAAQSWQSTSAGDTYGKDTTRNSEDAAASVFLKAVEKTLTERAQTYPPYSQEAERVALLWNIIRPQARIDAADVALFMMTVKMVRYAAGQSPDSLTDLVGYAARLEGMDADKA